MAVPHRSAHPQVLTPKRLDFSGTEEDSESNTSSPPKRAKRHVLDNPATPTTHLKLAQGPTHSPQGSDDHGRRSKARPKYPRLIEAGLKGMRLFDDGAHRPVTSPKTVPKSEAESRSWEVARNRRRSEPSTVPLGGTPMGQMRRRLTLEKKSSAHARRPVRKNRLANINPFTPDVARLLGLDDTPSKAPATQDGSFTPVSNHPPRCSYEDLKSSIQKSLDQICQNTPSDGNDLSFFSDSPPTKCKSGSVSTPSRYDDEFMEIKQLGNGSFGQVKIVRHRLDGCIYVVKITGTTQDRAVMNEVFAHAALMKHKHIVRYYNSWIEKGRIFIQNEFCEGGSLDKLIAKKVVGQKKFTENELKRILFHLSKGLQYIHSKNLVHLDIKPANIFISLDNNPGLSPTSSVESCSSQAEVDHETDSDVMALDDLPVNLQTKEDLPPKPENIQVTTTPHRVSRSVQTTPRIQKTPKVQSKGKAHESTDSGNVSSGSESKPEENILDKGVSFKIGDLGHICSLNGDYMPEEGDCRYMAPELFANDIVRDNLFKADIFSLGLTIYECATQKPLPKNSLDGGDLYAKLRSGNPPPMEGYSDEFNALIKSMLSPDVMVRPSASRLVSHQLVKSVINKTRSNLDLYKELRDTRMKLKELEKTLATANLKKKLLVGRGARKSNSSY